MIRPFDFPLSYQNHFCGCDLIATNIKLQFLKRRRNLFFFDNSILLQNDCLIYWYTIHDHGNGILSQLKRFHGIQIQSGKPIINVKVCSIYHSIKTSIIKSICIRVTIWGKGKIVTNRVKIRSDNSYHSLR